MKKRVKACVLAALAIILSAPVFSPAAGRRVRRPNRKTSSFGVGARRHTRNPMTEDLPFDDGDWSYGAVYQGGDASVRWQLAALYASSPGTNDMDYAITPQANLIVKQDVVLAGVGMLKTYMVDADGESDWSDLYWQVMGGFELPIGGFTLSAYAYYTLDKWGDFFDFESDAVEFGGWLMYDF